MLQNILQYFVSPAIVSAIFLFVFHKVFNLGEFKSNFKNVVTDIETLKKDSKSLLNHMAVMKTHMVTNQGLNANLFIPGSPLKLLSKGLDLLEKMDFEKTYSDNTNWFLEDFTKRKVKTLADIDEVSVKVIERFYRTHKPNNLKEVAFQNGTTPDVLTKVLSIYLRDSVSKAILKS